MRARTVSLGVWLLLAALAVLVATRARYTADLSAFLPATPSQAQQVLVQQLRDGLASRLILIDIEAADAPTRTRLSRDLAARLRVQPAFRSVMNGEAAVLERDRAFIFAQRYQLSERVTPERFTVPGLRTAIADSLDVLASPLGLLAKDVFVRDPTGETLQALEQLQRAGGQPQSSDGIWVSRDQRRALLVAETRAAGSDSDGQQRAIGAVRAAFAAAVAAAPGKPAAPADLKMTGPGVFAAEARATIEHDAIRLSVLSSALIATLLMLVYRSLPALLLGLMPVASGALAGVAAVALGFGVVHGVTLGFGVTLIGEAVDYSVYLFIQAQPAPSGASDTRPWTATLWPTVRLGMLTSICGFASLLPSAFPGLAQLGLYSIAGLVAAGLTTRYVLPQLVPVGLAPGTAMALGTAIARALPPLRTMRRLLWLLPLIAGLVLYLHRDRLWNHELAALSPVSAAAQRLDGELRADLGAPDVRTLLVLSGANAEAVLEAAETVGAALEPLIAAGVLASYQSPSRYLPSAATQQRRRASLPPREQLARQLQAAVAGLPIRPERLQPFLADVEAARIAPVIRRADLEATSLASAVDALLVLHGGVCSALLPLAAPASGQNAFAIDVGRVTRAVAAASTPGVAATVLDLKREADGLYSGYLSEALRLSAAGFGTIVLLLLIALRAPARVVRVLSPLVLAVLAVTSGFALAGRALTILHLIGLLLIVAIGSNYALFFDRRLPVTSPQTAARMLASLVIANFTTVLAFGVLAFSSIPVLAALGATVAPGTLLALLFAAVLAEDAPLPARSR